MSDSEDEVEFEKEEFQIGPYNLNITTIAFMPLHKLMELNTNKVEISGQKLWCGSLSVVEYILSQSGFCENNSIIELGAGTGVVSMICSLLNCKSAFLTDHDKQSLDHMNIDCKDNNIKNATIVRLDWFSPDYSFLKNTDCDCRKIVAGDVIYKFDLIEPFFNVVHTLFYEHEVQEMLLCHIPRAGVNHDIVEAAAVKAQLCCTEIDKTLWCKGVVLEYSPEQDYSRAKLYNIKKI